LILVYTTENIGVFQYPFSGFQTFYTNTYKNTSKCQYELSISIFRIPDFLHGNDIIAGHANAPDFQYPFSGFQTFYFLFYSHKNL